MGIVEDSMREHGRNPEDYVELTCPTPGCRKPQIARPIGDGNEVRVDKCLCEFQMSDVSKPRLFLYAFGGPPFWALVHRDDVPKPN